VRGSLPLEKLARLTGKPVESAPDYASLAGLLLEIAGRVPPAGSRFQVGELLFEVVEASSRRIERVRVTVSVPPA
jgi:putative hemolysin